jgi:ferrous iron transport protein B
MHNHGAAAITDAPPGAKNIVLAGNPNTGKSVVFNFLSELYTDVSNFPGTTVEFFQGRMGQDSVFDTPGIYGVSSFSDEERVARHLILLGDTIVNVVDATHLQRDLFLTLQLIDMGRPMVVALNMMDEAAARGIRIDLDLLQRSLGVPVFPTVATQKKGLEDLRQGLDKARAGDNQPYIDERLTEIGDSEMPQAEAVLLLEGDVPTADNLGREPMTYRDDVYGWRRGRVDHIVSEVITSTGEEPTWQGRLGQWMMQPLTGIPLLFATLFVMYKVLGELVAGNLVGFTEETVGQEIWEPWIRGLVARVVAEGSALETILTGDFGILTMTVTYMFGVILPLVIGFYLMLSVLEDSGYMPRIAVMVDGLLQRLGLNGRAVIPMILGFGCVTMATISARMLGSTRERMIITYLMALAIPCSAQLGVIIGILAILGGGMYTLAYAGTIFLTFVVAGTLLARFIPGQSTDLLLDIPPVRMSRPGNVLRKTVTRAYMFTKEVSLFFGLGALLLSVMQITGALKAVQDGLTPLTENWLKLPAETATAFVMGFVRRDFGAAGLYQGDDLNILLTPMQSLVALVAITLFVPCIASVLIILKERGTRYLVATWLGAIATAFLVAGVVARFGEVLTR